MVPLQALSAGTAMSARLAPVSLALLGLQMVAAAVPPAGAAPTPVPSASAPIALEAMLEPVRSRYSLPALAAAVVIEGKVVAVGAVGTRKAGAQIPVQRSDRFHLGSDTKAMTSLLAAMAVEEGQNPSPPSASALAATTRAFWRWW
ncbi:beta-lactamase family protein [Cyanobium sp. FGCU-6]|nr:beta-lactamase family protein [Cyanobium sp. FGCU6]